MVWSGPRPSGQLLPGDFGAWCESEKKKKKKRYTTESEVGDGAVRWDRDIERLGGASVMSHVSPWGRSTPPLRESEDGNRGCLWTVGGGYLVFYRDQMKFWSPNRV